jgi:hypothetical protein
MGRPNNIPRFRHNNSGSGRGFGTAFAIIAALAIIGWLVSMR